MRITWRNLRAGNAFCIPLHDGNSGVGLVLIAGRELYLGVFESLLGQQDDLSQNMGALGRLRLVGLTTDELFYRGDWTVIGDLRVPSYPRPKHVVNSQEGLVLCDFDGKTLRPAIEEVDLPRFGFRKSVSNVAFTKALNCLHGAGRSRL